MRANMLVVAVLVILAGCSANERPRDAGSHEDQGLWSVEEAGERYLDISKSSNEARSDAKALADSLTLPQAKAACRRIVDADGQFIHDLSAGKWPVNAQEPIQDLTKKLARQRSAYLDCAEATDTTGVVDALLRAKEANGGEADVVRAALRLPALERSSPSGPGLDEPRNKAGDEGSTCAAARESLLTGTDSEINTALEALIADKSANVEAREAADRYLHGPAGQRDDNKELLQIACRG